MHDRCSGDVQEAASMRSGYWLCTECAYSCLWLTAHPPYGCHISTIAQRGTASIAQFWLRIRMNAVTLVSSRETLYDHSFLSRSLDRGYRGYRETNKRKRNNV